MQQLKLNEENIIEPEKGFWRRQFQTEATASQIKFDWIFGVVLPVICFAFDPVVFKGNALGEAFLGTYKPFAYILSFVSIMAMSGWLIWGAKLKWLNALLAGLFIVGSIISLIVGVILLPFSLLGLVVLIGILGFTPLCSSIVFLRNSLRAYRAAKPFLERGVLIHLFALGVIFSLVVPYVTNVEVKRNLDEIIAGDAQMVRKKASNLKYVAPLVNFDPLAIRYHRSAPSERETEKMKAIVEVYKELTGEDLEKKARILMD